MRKLTTALKRLEISHEKDQVLMLEEYMRLLLIKNKNLNLTAITEKDEFIVKHYIDSLLVTQTPEFKEATDIVDIGTGGGFPAIPLAVFYPEKNFLLVDSLAKRLWAVEEMAKEIGLKNISIVHGRAEELGKSDEYREKYDLVLSRAVAPLVTLSEYCLPFVKVGGNFIAYKTLKAGPEIEEAQKAIMLLGGEFKREEKNFDVSGKTHHTLVVVFKNRKTPLKYPRKAGTPSKNPLIKKNVSRGTSDKKASNSKAKAKNKA